MSLTQLPTETLVQICQDVFEEGYGRADLARLGRSCKRLYEISQPIIYRKIKKRNCTVFPKINLLSLIETLDGNPYLASLVTVVEISFQYTHSPFQKLVEHRYFRRFFSLAQRYVARHIENIDRKLWQQRDRGEGEMTGVAIAVLLSLTKNIVEATIPCWDPQSWQLNSPEAPIELPHLRTLRIIGGVWPLDSCLYRDSYIIPILEGASKSRNGIHVILDHVWCDDLLKLPNLASLLMLEFPHFHTTDTKPADVLRMCSQLKELSIEQCYNTPNPSPIPPSRFFDMVGPAANHLQKLRLGGKEPWLFGRRFVDGQWKPEGALRTTSPLAALEELSIDAIQCEDLQGEESLVHLIEHCPNLQVLELRDISLRHSVSERAVAYFAEQALASQIPHLRELRLYSEKTRSSWTKLNAICESSLSAFASSNVRLVLRISGLDGQDFSGDEWDAHFAEWRCLDGFLSEHTSTWWDESDLERDSDSESDSAEITDDSDGSLGDDSDSGALDHASQASDTALGVSDEEF